MDSWTVIALESCFKKVLILKEKEKKIRITRKIIEISRIKEITKNLKS